MEDNGNEMGIAEPKTKSREQEEIQNEESEMKIAELKTKSKEEAGNEKRLEELKKTINGQEGRLQNLQSTAFQLANYYFVFQGVILTAICNGTTSLRCSDRWFLFSLSLLAAVLNLVALSITGLKYLRTIEQQDYNWCECNELEKSLQKPSTNQASDHQHSVNQSRTRCHDPFRQFKRYFWFSSCMLLFLSFAIITLWGCWQIVCRKYEFENKNDQCIKLCNGIRCIRICTEY